MLKGDFLETRLGALPSRTPFPQCWCGLRNGLSSKHCFGLVLAAALVCCHQRCQSSFGTHYSHSVKGRFSLLVHLKRQNANVWSNQVQDNHFLSQVFSHVLKCLSLLTCPECCLLVKFHHQQQWRLSTHHINFLSSITNWIAMANRLQLAPRGVSSLSRIKFYKMSPIKCAMKLCPNLMFSKKTFYSLKGSPIVIICCIFIGHLVWFCFIK